MRRWFAALVPCLVACGLFAADNEPAEKLLRERQAIVDSAFQLISEVSKKEQISALRPQLSTLGARFAACNASLEALPNVVETVMRLAEVEVKERKIDIDLVYANLSKRPGILAAR